jgi:tetratricopeptide (TPR) repeat protein
MSKIRFAFFFLFALLAVALGAGAGAVAIAAFSPSVQVPELSARFADQDDSVLTLWVAGSAGAVWAAWLAGWLLSLDPRHRRRPWISLFILGLGPGALAGAMAWLYAVARQGVDPESALWVGASAAAATSFALLTVEWLLGRVVRRIALALARTNALGAARFWTRQWQRLRPSDTRKGLGRQLGLLDYRLERFADAQPRLLAEWEAGRADLEVREALWMIAAGESDDALLVRVGPEMLQDEATMTLSPAKVRRRLAEIAAREGRVSEAIDLMEKAIDRDNPADLEALGRLYLHEKRWGEMEDILERLLRAEAPPRPRRSKLFNAVLRESDPASLPLIKREAQTMREAKREEDEADLLEQVLKLDPDTAAARTRLIEIYRARERPDRLVDLLRASQERGGDVSAATASELSELLTGLRRYGEAEEMARRFGEVYSEDWRFPRHVAAVQLARGELDEAEISVAQAEALAAAKEEDREKIKPLRRKIEAALDRRDLANIEERARAHPDDAELRLELVERLVRRGRLERASVEAATILERLPDQRVLVKERLRGLIGQNASNYLLADYLARLMIQDQEFDEAHRLFGTMAQASLDPGQTMREGARRILEVNADHRPSHFRLFELAVKAGAWDEAAAHANRYLELQGELDYERSSALFEAYCKLRDLERGAPLGKQLLADHPFEIGRVLKLAELYLFHNQFPEAHALLARAKEIEPGNNNIYALLDAAKARQREKRSLELRLLIDKDPENADLLAELAAIMVEFKRYEEALRLYQRAAQRARDEDQRLVCQTWLAWCMMKRHMFDTSMETLREAPLGLAEGRKSQGERKRIFYEIAEALEDNNQHEDAAELYKQVFKVDAGFRHVMQKMEQLSR